MIRYQHADATALEELFARVSPSLLRYFGGPGLGRNDAEDLLQECWIRIHRSRHTYRSLEPLMPWLYAIARHTRLDGYRSRRRLESREVLVGSIPDNHSKASRPLPSEESDFASLLAGLPEGQRELLVMLKVSGMSLEEVAQATSSTVGAVKQKVHRAYAALRRTLGENRENARQPQRRRA